MASESAYPVNPNNMEVDETDTIQVQDETGLSTEGQNPVDAAAESVTPSTLTTGAPLLGSKEGRPNILTTTYSGPPVVLNIPSLASSFASLSGGDRKVFIAALHEKIGRPYNTKIASRGDLFVQPHTEAQKTKLLALKMVSAYQVNCEKTRAEREDRGVIHQVPLDYSDDYLKSHLSNQDVVDIKRRNRYEAEDRIVPTTTVVLTFASSKLPTGVNIDGVNHVVSRFETGPDQCYNCWEFGHIMRNCGNDVICRYCSGNHPSNINCGHPKKCPTCKKDDHHAGTKKCRVFLERAKALAITRTSGGSFADALRSTSTNNSTGAVNTANGRFQPYGHSDVELEICKLKERLATIASNDGGSMVTVMTRLEALEKENETIRTTLSSLADLPDRVAATEGEIKAINDSLKDIPNKKDMEDMMAKKNEELITMLRCPPPPPLQRGTSTSNLSQTSSSSQGSTPAQPSKLPVKSVNNPCQTNSPTQGTNMKKASIKSTTTLPPLSLPSIRKCKQKAKTQMKAGTEETWTRGRMLRSGGERGRHAPHDRGPPTNHL